MSIHTDGRSHRDVAQTTILPQSRTTPSLWNSTNTSSSSSLQSISSMCTVTLQRAVICLRFRSPTMWTLSYQDHRYHHRLYMCHRFHHRVHFHHHPRRHPGRHPGVHEWKSPYRRGRWAFSTLSQEEVPLGAVPMAGTRVRRVDFPRQVVRREHIRGMASCANVIESIHSCSQTTDWLGHFQSNCLRSTT